MTRSGTGRRGESIGGGEGLRLELWAQPGAATRGELDAVLDGLRELDRRGRVDAASVETWDRFVDLSAGADAAARRARRRMGGFAAIAGDRGGAFGRERPAGEVVRVGVGRMGPERLAWRTPRAALVEFRGGEVVRVTPGRDSPAAIRRRLDQLADGGRARDRDDRDSGARLETGSSRARGGRRPARPERRYAVP